MENDESDSDIVRALSDRLMNDIVEKIFDYLDYESLKSSEAVSPVWRENIFYGKTWKNLLCRNLKLSPDWMEMLDILSTKWSLDTNISNRDCTYYHSLCQQVGNSVLSLKRNWSQGLHAQYQFTDFSQPEVESIFWIRGSLSFEMDKKWIGRGQRDGSVILWNRWTWKVKALYEPLLLTNRLLGCNTVRCLQFNDEIVVASYFGGSICVWDIDTTELLQVLDEMDVANYDSHYIPMNGLSLGGLPGSYWLLSCLSSPTEQDFITLRVITSPSIDIPIVHRIMLDQNLRVLRSLVNELYAFLLLSDTVAKQDKIQIRSVSTMDIVRIIQIPYSEMGVFDFRNGMILTGSRYEIQLWNTETGTCLRSVRNNNCIVFVKIISDKYFVSCSASGKVQVWDLKEALNSSYSDSLLLYQLNATSMHCPLLCPIVRADEYHIALIPCRGKDYSELHIIDFLQLDQQQRPIERE